MADDGYVIVLVTTSSTMEAERLSEALVDERLAACVSIVGPMTSIYRWRGTVERAQEHLLMIKTRAALFDSLAARVRELHSYENPEIVALPIAAGAAAYLDWLRANTQPD